MGEKLLKKSQRFMQKEMSKIRWRNIFFGQSYQNTYNFQSQLQFMWLSKIKYISIQIWILCFKNVKV